MQVSGMLQTTSVPQQRLVLEVTQEVEISVLTADSRPHWSHWAKAGKMQLALRKVKTLQHVTNC